MQEIQGERLLGSAAVSLACQPCKLSDSVGEGLGEIGPLENTGPFWKCLRNRLTCATMI